jgi:nucleotide-binding universal stress UspA family protein
MARILIPVDKSASTRHALQHAIEMAHHEPGTEVHLLHVQPLMPVGTHAYRSLHEIATLEAAESEQVLKPARSIFDAAHIPYITASRAGPIAPTIARYAEERKCDHIVMGMHGIPVFGTFVAAPTTARVLHLTRVPVTLVK